MSGKREVVNAKTAVRRLWRLFLEEQQPIEVANTTSPQRILDDSDSDDSADDEAYRAAFSSFTTPSAVATAKQKALERELYSMANTRSASPRSVRDTWYER